MSTKYTPGATVTVGDLEVGDTIFLREQIKGFGKPEPLHPAKVVALTPIPNGRVRVEVRNALSSDVVPARSLGDLPATREFRAAVAV